MADLHIDDFHKDVAKVFTGLYGTFPRKQTVFVEDICGPDEPDEFGLHSVRHRACLATMLWLADEGYIRFEDTIRQEAIDQATLTHKGFTILSAQLSCRSHLPDGATLVTPQLGQEATGATVAGDYAPAIELLRVTLRGGSSAAIAQIVQILLNR